MIVLNVEKELVTVKDWSDILDRPGFTSSLDPGQHTLKAILGRYVIQERVRCGLSNCHTPHAKGYVVSTASGLETNIGQDCGRIYFGVDFETMTKKFERDLTEKENRDKLFGFSFRFDEIKRQITELRTQERGANWVHKHTRSLLEAGRSCPAGVVRSIGSMAKMRNSMLVRPREATDKEIEQLEGMQGRRLSRPHYIEEPLAEIVGLEALFPENDVRQLLVMNIEQPLKEFEKADIDVLGFEALRSWARWVGTVEPTLERAADAIAHGRRLLRPENLESFAQLLTDKNDQVAFMKYLKGLQVA